MPSDRFRIIIAFLFHEIFMLCYEKQYKIRKEDLLSWCLLSYQAKQRIMLLMVGLYTFVF